MSKYISFLLSVILFFNETSTAQNTPVTAKEYKKVFPTYPYSDPDPIPVPGRIYPYYRFDGYTDKSIQKEWKIVELENDYIKVLITPEIGGKIWGAIEKSTGKEFIYYNHAVKFRDIALRGAWTSGGLDGNYGVIGHTANCATPVDYIIINRPDGSISCVVGAFDLITRTSWRLDINLPSDKAYFTTSSFWHNSTPLEQPYYTWMCAGIKAKGNLEFIFPGTGYIGHNGEYSDWNINKENGRDVSFYEQNNFGTHKSYHVLGKNADFFGGYWHDDDFGMGSYATRDDKAGKKIWIWSQSRQGMIWEDLLTDTDGQYVEVQSGRLFNQASGGSNYTPFKNKNFMPYATDTWTEYWFPVKETKGFVQANNYGALNVKKENGRLKIYFSPVQKINDTLSITAGQKSIYKKYIHLKPLEVFADSIQTAFNREEVIVKLGDNKLVYDGNPATGVNDRPVKIPEDFTWGTPYALYAEGREQAKMRDPEAEATLQKCIKKDPYFLPGLTEYAILLYRNMEYEKSITYSKRALSLDTYDPCANFYYALANLWLNNTENAKDGLQIASQSVEYRSAAFTELSKIYIRENDFKKALEYAEKSMATNKYNVEGLRLMAVIYRLTIREATAAEVLARINAFDPLNHFAHFEKYITNPSEQNKNSFLSLIRNEMPQEVFLELAAWYNDLHLKNEALKIIQFSPVNAEVLYWKAYLENKSVDTNKLNPELVFPFREETARVLEQLIKTNNYWLLKYHLALIWWGKNNTEKAKKLFTQCGMAPAYAPFYTAKANLFSDDSKITEAGLLQAIALDKKQWRNGKALINFYIDQNQFSKALSTAETYHKQSPANYIIGMLYAKTLMLNNQYKNADALLGKLRVLPFENSTEGRELYREAKLLMALEQMQKKNYSQALLFIADSRLWPENLGAGKPYEENIDGRLEDWMSYLCYEKMNKPDLAKAALRKIISFTPKVENTLANFLAPNALVSAWVIEKETSREKAVEWIDGQMKLFPDREILNWCKKVFTENKQSPLQGAATNATVRVLEQLMQLK
jgi:tetratricopeptide (TPR) repeat protein